MDDDADDTIAAATEVQSPLRAAGGEGQVPEGPRYLLGDELGVGGFGKVIAARDRALGRTVAMKTLRHAGDAGAHGRFVDEARVAGQLEHPSVIPVYDLGVLGDGEPFYTMRIVERRSLREVLRQPPPRRDWPLARLCTMFVQVCRAMAYAHVRGIVHRDLKPDNILLGEYGEVYVADWGLAAALGTEEGGVVGTPGYMAPEQAEGRLPLDPRSDLYALGVCLYEILTDERPRTPPRPPRDLTPGCPLVLEDLCLRMLAPSAAERPASADVVAAEVESFLEGAREKARRAEEARRLVERAEGPARRNRELATERERLLRAALAARRGVAAWDGIEKKRAAWDLEDAAAAAEVEQARALADAVELHAQALAYAPDLPEAHRGLAELYWERARAAERERRDATRVYYESLVLDHDDGRFAAILLADGRVSLESDPPGAEVTAYRFVEQDRVLRPLEPRGLGVTPVREASLPPGSWLLIVRKPGFRDTRYPVVSRRGEHHEGRVRLFTDAQIGADFLHVPAGRCVIGGDPDAWDSLPREEIDIADFAMARFAVTYREYLPWLDELETRDPAEAARRLPRSPATAEICAIRGPDGRYVPHWEQIVEGDAARYCPRERAMDLPIESIDWLDANAYCAWRGARDGCTYRLPTEAEWEKAARGVDGRFFVMGDRFDPTFAKMRDSRPGFGQPEPVGNFPLDESLYGIRDLAGTIRCWAADIHGELTAEEALAHTEPEGMRIERGGAWVSPTPWCRAASRHRYFLTLRSSFVGIRLVKSL
jgi:serine/threonine-protein kinase